MFFEKIFLCFFFTSHANYQISIILKTPINTVKTVDSSDDFNCEIRLQIKWKCHEILQNNFEPNLSFDGDIFYGLKIAYRDYFKFKEYIMRIAKVRHPI